MSHHRRDIDAAPMDSGGDPFLALPDELVQHMLGFLPAQDAVRTSLLARRWRHLWRALPRLRIFGEGVTDLSDFVHYVLVRRRPGAALRECEFDFSSQQGLSSSPIELWIRQALARGVQVLRVRFSVFDRPHFFWPLVSRHLRSLELGNLSMYDRVLNFSNCPVLEDLKITDCSVAAYEILSPSLKHLEITGCLFHFCQLGTPTHVSTPNHTMPLLETAVVELGHFDKPPFRCQYRHPNPDEAEECCCGTCPDGACVLLRGLSNVTTLELIASVRTVSFERDIRFCPTFNKLKTLLLTDWCLVTDLDVLLCFLQHTPVLGKLVLQLPKTPKCAAQEEGWGPMNQSLLLSELKTLVVKCPKLDERVRDTLNLLFSCSTYRGQVIVQEM